MANWILTLQCESNEWVVMATHLSRTVVLEPHLVEFILYRDRITNKVGSSRILPIARNVDSAHDDDDQRLRGRPCSNDQPSLPAARRPVQAHRSAHRRDRRARSGGRVRGRPLRTNFLVAA